MTRPLPRPVITSAHIGPGHVPHINLTLNGIAVTYVENHSVIFEYGEERMPFEELAALLGYSSSDMSDLVLDLLATTENEHVAYEYAGTDVTEAVRTAYAEVLAEVYPVA